MDIKQLKEKSRNLQPALRIGKNGLNDSVIGEIIHQLKKHKLVKIKLLKAAMEEKGKEELRKEILDRTNSILVSHVGFVITLYKK